jgi:Carotenoid biosynthesis protein
MGLIATDGSVTDTSDPSEKKVIWTMWVALIVSTIFFTVIHHAYPAVFDVPDNSAVPMMGLGTMFLFDLMPIFMAWLCFYHAVKYLGKYRAMLFLGGSFIFTGLEESMWILLGRYQTEITEAFGGAALQEAALGAHAHEVTGTYWFTMGFFWFFETPLLACLGWFFVAYSCVYVADLLIPKAKIIWRATLGGLLAMNLDLWLDPVQTHEKWQSWIWCEGDRINIFSIPFSNFVGWFLLIFLFAIVFDKVPDMLKKWGAVKTAIYFYLILFALELGILAFFVVYGSVAMRVLPDPINLTIWGI